MTPRKNHAGNSHAQRKPPLKTKGKHNLKKAIPADQKERGEWVELLFMANAARLGLKVARPHGDSARFDVIVECGGRLYRVQVKSTLFNRKGCYECLCFWSTTPGRPTPVRPGEPAPKQWKKREAHQYSDEQIDFVAAYVVPEDAWFIIPASEIRTKTLYLPPRERAGRSRYGRFLEAWHLLGAAENGRLTILASAENDLVLEMIRAKVVELSAVAR